MKRILVVYNPRSSQFCHVKTEVLNKLPNLKSYMIGKYAIKKTNFDDNVATLKELVKDQDLIISTGGDATASIALNAIIASSKDATLAVLPYGNFNDLARTLRTKNLEEIVNRTNKAVNFYPLEVYIDGKLWRYASCYVTIGMTAEAVEIFDHEKLRKNLQKGHRHPWRSYFHLASWYFKNRHKKSFIPEFKLNGESKHPKTSDYAAVNGRTMASIMKGGEDYKKPKIFRSETDRLTNFWRLCKLMIKSIFSRIPGTETNRDLIEFTKPSTVELQAEGEYRKFKDISTIEIKKGTKCLKVIQN